jgi:hypothetical protein
MLTALMDWTHSKGQTTGGASINVNPFSSDYIVESDVMSETAKSSGQKLGGKSLQIPMHEAILQATLKRITEEEKSISSTCGTSSTKDVKKDSKSTT